MYQKFDKKAIRRMKRAYLKTESLALAAKICDCSPGTVKRYRDREGWIGWAIRPLPDAGGPTLTPNIAMNLAAGWQLHISDDSLCARLGLTISQLKGWLTRNTEVTIIRSVKKKGKPNEERQETIGLRDLRTRERESLEVGLCQEHRRLREGAEKAKQYGPALRGVEWELESHFPKKYGTKGQAAAVNVNVNQAVQSNVVSIDDLNLPLETRKQILAQLRAQQANEQEGGQS